MPHHSWGWAPGCNLLPPKLLQSGNNTRSQEAAALRLWAHFLEPIAHLQEQINQISRTPAKTSDHCSSRSGSSTPLVLEVFIFLCSEAKGKPASRNTENVVNGGVTSVHPAILKIPKRGEWFLQPLAVHAGCPQRRPSLHFAILFPCILDLIPQLHFGLLVSVRLLKFSPALTPIPQNPPQKTHGRGLA